MRTYKVWIRSKATTMVTGNAKSNDWGPSKPVTIWEAQDETGFAIMFHLSREQLLKQMKQQKGIRFVIMN